MLPAARASTWTDAEPTPLAHGHRLRHVGASVAARGDSAIPDAAERARTYKMAREAEPDHCCGKGHSLARTYWVGSFPPGRNESTTSERPNSGVKVQSTIPSVVIVRSRHSE